MTGGDGGGWSSDTVSPLHWPSLSASEAGYEWDDLRRWVEGFVERYPIGSRLPDCWWHHPCLVELMSALRDHERVSFGRSAPGTAAMEWQHARAAVEGQVEIWAKRMPCQHAEHEPRELRSRPDGWADHVRQDIERRGRSRG